MDGAGLVDSAIREVPFDFATIQGVPDWRGTLAWPLSHARAFSAGRVQERAYLNFTNRLGDEKLRRVALLGGGRAISVGLALTEAALCVQEEARAGIRLLGGPAELDILRGEPPSSDKRPWQTDSPFKPMASPGWIWLRRLARVASYTPLWRLPATLIAPTVTAVTHNGLLCADARRSPERVGFYHAEALLSEARRRRSGRQGLIDITDLAAAVADLLARGEGLEEPFVCRLRSLLLPMMRTDFLKAAFDLDALAALAKLPKALWSGSGGYYPSRAVGLEVQRRGGCVTRFSHSGMAGMTEVVEPTAFTELAVSDRFVVETEQAAANLAATEALALIDRFNRPVIVGSSGYPGLRRLPLVSHRRPTRRAVVYAPTILKGFRQFFPPLLPDVIYLDWQYRLVESMLRMPIDLICKPHPEGLLRGRIHPLAAVAPTTTKRFEEVMGEADVFVFDYAQSTTFYEALCTDRPIVYMDMGNLLFNKSVLPMITRRCRVLQVRFDARNLPWIDEAELHEAICGGGDLADPGEFRALLMGEGDVA